MSDLEYTELSSMSGGDKIADEVFSNADGTEVRIPVSKLAHGEAGVMRMVTAGDPLPCADRELLAEVRAAREELRSFLVLVLEKLR